MNQRIVRLAVLATVSAAAVFAIGWLLYTFIYEGSITIDTKGQQSTVIITNDQGQQVAKGSGTSFRVAPGTYTVAVQGQTSGVTKKVSVSSLSTTTVTLAASETLQTTQIAPVGLFGAFTSGDSVIGLDPADMRVKRIDRLGAVTDQITSGQLANQPIWEAELPDPVQSYQPYQHGQALVADDGVLYLVSSTAITEISTVGIAIDQNSGIPAQLIIAAQPGTESFVVAYKNDVFLYTDTKSTPKKIYTSQKTFDAVSYGNNRVAVFYANMPDSRQDLRSQYDAYVIDPVFIDTAHNNQTQSVPGPVTHISLSPNGQLAVVQPRHQQSYLYDLQKQQNLTYVDTPLVGWPLWLSNTTYAYTKQTNVWQYDTNSRFSTLLGKTQYEATSVYKDDSGSFVVTAYSGRGQASVYRLGGAAHNVPTSQVDTLNQILPYTSSGLFSITFSNVSSPTVVIHTMAPLNDIRQLDQYKQLTEQYRQAARDYLTKHEIDLSKLTVTYDPADPLQ